MDGGQRPSDTHDGLWVARSTDGGRHWTGRQAVANVYTSDGCTGPDRPTLTVDPRTGALWVAYQHLTFTSQPCAMSSTSDVRVVRSTDGGRSWSRPVVVASDPATPPYAAVAAPVPGGGVAVAFLQSVALGVADRHCAYYSSVRLATVTSGLRVSPARVLLPEVCQGPSGTAAPGSFETVPPNPTIAVDHRTGRLVVAVGNARPGSPEIAVTVSDAQGGQLTRTSVTAPPGSTPIMPQLAAGAGRFALSYLADLPGGTYRPQLVSSADGLTWSAPVELASTPSLGNARPQALVLDPFSIGRYQGLAIGADRVAHAAWPDLRPSSEPQATRTYVRGVPLP